MIMLAHPKQCCSSTVLLLLLVAGGYLPIRKLGVQRSM